MHLVLSLSSCQVAETSQYWMEFYHTQAVYLNLLSFDSAIDNAVFANRRPVAIDAQTVEERPR